MDAPERGNRALLHCIEEEAVAPLKLMSMLHPLFATYDSASLTPSGERSKVELTVIQSVEGVSVSIGGEIAIDTGFNVGVVEIELSVNLIEPEDIIRTGIRTSLTPPIPMMEESC